MVDSPGEQWAGGAILELGAGSGLPSILCSRYDRLAVQDTVSKSC
jgi:predicted nicotinamide N-methyase